MELAIPKLRQGTYYPEWLLERRRRAERALATVVATSYLLGVSTRRVEKLAESLGVTKLSRSQVSVMAAELDDMVTQFRSRPLDAGPYAFVWTSAITQKVREGGRTVNVHALSSHAGAVACQRAPICSSELLTDGRCRVAREWQGTPDLPVAASSRKSVAWLAD